MMKYLVILFLLVGYSETLKAVEQDTIYITRKGFITTKDSAAYFRIVTKMGEDKYKIQDYYLTGIQQMLGYNATPEVTMRNGEYIYYDSLGNVSSFGNYKYGLKFGEWTNYYHGTKNVAFIRVFNENNRSNTFKQYDSVSKKLIKEGAFNLNENSEGLWKFYYNESGNLRYFLNFNNGLIQGESIEYYEDGLIKRKETYSNGKILKGKLFDQNGGKQKYYPREERVVFKSSIYQHVLKGVKSLSRAGGLNKITVKLIISKEGKISDAQIIENPFPENNDEIIKALLQFKEIEPAKQENQPVECTILLRW
jgi:antitoxin component YwqK of YwqJK toxin-antitoxin module